MEKDALENGDPHVRQIVEVGKGQDRDTGKGGAPVDLTEEWTGSEDAFLGTEPSEDDALHQALKNYYSNVEQWFALQPRRRTSTPRTTDAPTSRSSTIHRQAPTDTSLPSTAR